MRKITMMMMTAHSFVIKFIGQSLQTDQIVEP